MLRNSVLERFAIMLNTLGRHGRARPGHPRLGRSTKTWMPATSAGMTV